MQPQLANSKMLIKAITPGKKPVSGLIYYNTRKIYNALRVFIVVLVACSILAKGMHHFFKTNLVANIDFLFNLDEEHNVPALFSFLQLLFAGMLLWIISYMVAKAGQRDAGYWKLMAFLFFYIAIDELESIHERFGAVLHSLLHTSGIFYFAWIIAAILILAVLGLVLLGFLQRLPADTRKRFLVAGIVYITGAVGGDLVGGAYISAHGNGLGWPYVLEYHVEETMEMLAIAYFIYSILRHIETHMSKSITFRNNRHQVTQR
jgi:MFS family permease